MQLVRGKHLTQLGSMRAIPSLRHAGSVSPARVAARPLLPLPSLASSSQRRSYADRKLDLPALDQKWRNHWKSTQSSAGGNTSKEGMYILPMFPYPSGYLHLGHLRVYTITDVIARFRTLQGYDVLLPMGWDAFGLPAENAAIERGIAPATWTRNNIAKMKEQLDMMNGSWDWDRELATCDPDFYKHTQKLFLMMYERGLAYQAEAEVNYDPIDKTVLANEQVDANGRSWRSGALVEKRELKQWFFRISEFRDDLLNNLETLAEDGAWPERVLTMQKNWLGKSNGATIKFPVMAVGHDIRAAIEVFTTRPETLFGVQYLALASTHPVVADLAQNDPELQAFLDTIPGLPHDSKVGYMLPHLRAVNPLAYHENTPDATKVSIPVYVAPYVLGDYGDGAVMGVPGHDIRDNAFWKEHHYDEPVRMVLAASEDESTTAMANEPFVEHGIMTSHTGPFKGKSSTEAGRMLVSMLEQAELAKPIEKWRLRDWLISRQRYWGTPIPIIHCDSCGPVPVPDDQLPVELPEVDGHWAERKAGNPLETAEDWISTSCPKCGEAAKRDTDTMDTFVDSSWYYARFTDPKNATQPFSIEAAKSLPVDLYVGGVEHAILHLLYARFFYKFLKTTPLIPKSTNLDSVEEPFKRLITQGMVHGKTYSDPATGRFLKPDEVDLTNPAAPRVAGSEALATVSFEKMSKSKHNGVDPTDFIVQYGADATRAHMLFQAPVSDVLNWDAEKIAGVTRWLNRLFQFVSELEKPSETNKDTVAAYFAKQSKKDGPEASNTEAAFEGATKELKQQKTWDTEVTIWRAVQDTIKSTTTSYEKVYSLNTVVSDLMGLTNILLDNRSSASPFICREAASAILRMLAPITPAFAEECWSILHPGTSSIFKSSFPVKDGSMSILQPTTQPCAVQVNGRLRAVVELPKVPSELKDLKLQEWIIAEILETEEGQTKLMREPFDIRSAGRVIIARGGKTVNFVIGGRR